MTGSQKRAYVMVDNKLALNAGWDVDLLADELSALIAELVPLISIPGFTIAEVDGLIDGQAQEDGAIRTMIVSRITKPSTASPSRAICGGWVRGDCSAGMPWTLGRRSAAAGEKGPRWCSLIRPTMCRSTVMSQGSARSSTASSPWPPAR